MRAARRRRGGNVRVVENYGIACGVDRATWVGRVGAGGLVPVRPDGEETVIPITLNGHPASTVLARGPDGAVWFTLTEEEIGRIDPVGKVTRVPVAADGLYGLSSTQDGVPWHSLMQARSRRPGHRGLTAKRVPATGEQNPGAHHRWARPCLVMHPQPAERHRPDRPRPSP